LLVIQDGSPSSKLFVRNLRGKQQPVSNIGRLPAVHYDKNKQKRLMLKEHIQLVTNVLK
jgi:hypothetical protein